MATEPGLGLDRLHDAYVRTHPRLWRSVLAWSGSRDVADEACAEAFAQAARHSTALRDADAWVWRAAFRIAAGELKRRRGSSPGAGGPGGAKGAAPVEVVGLDSVGEPSWIGPRPERPDRAVRWGVVHGAGHPSSRRCLLDDTRSHRPDAGRSDLVRTGPPGELTAAARVCPNGFGHR